MTHKTFTKVYPTPCESDKNCKQYIAEKVRRFDDPSWGKAKEFDEETVREAVKKTYKEIFFDPSIQGDKEGIFNEKLRDRLAQYALYNELSSLLGSSWQIQKFNKPDKIDRVYINDYMAVVKRGQKDSNFLLFSVSDNYWECEWGKGIGDIRAVDGRKPEFTFLVRIEPQEDVYFDFPVTERLTYNCIKRWKYDIPGFATYPDMHYIMNHTDDYRYELTISRGEYFGYEHLEKNNRIDQSYIQSGELRELSQVKGIMDQIIVPGKKIDWSGIKDPENEK